MPKTPTSFRFDPETHELLSAWADYLQMERVNVILFALKCTPPPNEDTPAGRRVSAAYERMFR